MHFTFGPVFFRLLQVHTVRYLSQCIVHYQFCHTIYHWTTALTHINTQGEERAMCRNCAYGWISKGIRVTRDEIMATCTLYTRPECISLVHEIIYNSFVWTLSLSLPSDRQIPKNYCRILFFSAIKRAHTI